MSGGRKAKELTDEKEIWLWDTIIFYTGKELSTSDRGFRSGISFIYEKALVSLVPIVGRGYITKMPRLSLSESIAT